MCGSSKCICLLKEEGEIASTSGAVCRSKYICTFSEFPRLHGKKKLIFVWNDLTYCLSVPVKYWTVPMNVYFFFWFPIVCLLFFDLQNKILLIWRGHYKWRRAAKFRNMIGTYGLWPLSDFYHSNLLWHGASVFTVSSKGLI